MAPPSDSTVAIRRILVEGGFLDGLDVEFPNGLIVLVGARGTGKTSLIELIRFALDAGRLTPTRDPYAHARAVLDGGRVTVTLESGGHQSVVARSAADDRAQTTAGHGAIILAQNEIEEVGLDPVGRLNLIDGLDSDRVDAFEEALLMEHARTLTHEVATIARELEQTSDRIAQLGHITTLQADAEAAEAQLKQQPPTSAPMAQQLEALTGRLSEIRVATDRLTRARDEIRAWNSELQDVIRRIPTLTPTTAPPPASLAAAAEHLANADAQLKAVVSEASTAVAGIELALSENQSSAARLDSDARRLRAELDALAAGASALTQTIARYRDVLNRRQALDAFAAERRSAMNDRIAAREAVFDDMGALRDERFRTRSGVVEGINTALRPKIEVAIRRSGMYDQYLSSLVEALKGSNLRYNALAPSIATQVAPYELARIVETGDAQLLATLAHIEPERAARVVGHLAEVGVSEIIVARVEDAVQFSLLDGSEYKRSEDLSTGQRCTVVLPILLTAADHVLVVDQPEDHLDNGFIVETVVKAIQKRDENSQLIFATHNANIPVLGEAEHVIHLDSDGKHGFVRHAARFDDEASVEVITSIMEGGRQAFALRAAFYEEHAGPA